MCPRCQVRLPFLTQNLADVAGSDTVAGGGVTANPFTEGPNTPEILVARLSKEEGRKVDEARAMDGELMTGLPRLSVCVTSQDY